MSTVNQVRSTFLDFFAKNGHEIVPSSPLVPRNDPTLMFTSAGMVQFKNVFTGQETRSYTRASTAQKCVRAGGKHNDLDNVGYTNRHHTFFEMLGNFSFGDYFKERAIPLAWELVTKDFGLDPKRLLVTIYHDDEVAYRTWKKVAGFSDDRIIRIATSDNFWSAGETGPCGPCSEIFLDQGDKVAGGPPGSADQDGDRFLEFWNLVFMQYEQRGPGDRIDLPKPSIDTGMGLERMTAILQGVQSVYDIDLFRALDRRVRGGHRRGGQRRAPGLAPRDRRPSARHELSDCRGRAAIQCGPRLRPAPHHAPRHAARPHARRQGAADVPAGAGTGAANGRDLSRAGARAAAHRRDPEAGRNALPQDAGERPGSPRRGKRLPGEGRRVLRRHRLQALRHLRLPARSDAGRLEAARHHGRPRGLRSGDAETEGGGAQGLEGFRRCCHRDRLVRAQGARRRHRLSGLRHGSGRGRNSRHPGRRQGGWQRQARRRSRAGAEPDAVLWRVRRPGR